MDGKIADVDVALEKIVKENACVEKIKNAVKMLTTVASNILKEPAEQKFRTLRKENKAVATKILPCRGALQLLVAIGFRSTDGVLAMPEERVEEARLRYTQKGLATVMERKAASDASARQAAAALKAAEYKEQQRLQREDKLARERERQRMAEQRQEIAARRAAEAHRRVQASVPDTAAPVVQTLSSTAASSSTRRKKSAPKRSAPAGTTPVGPTLAAGATQAAISAEAGEVEAAVPREFKRKQAAQLDAAVTEFQQQKKRRRFSPEDAASRIKGTHRSQSTNDASGAFGQVGRNAEANARQNAVSEGKYVVTEKKVAVANGGGAKLDVVYRLANGRSEAAEIVQKFDRQEVSR